MERKYYTEEQILDALSEVGVGAGDTSEVLSYLGRLPSPGKMGKWLSTPIYLGDAYKGYWRCSECQTFFKLKTKYCPNCGAGMEVKR